jgi:tetratricopeptide (TPR) repeat protein
MDNSTHDMPNDLVRYLDGEMGGTERTGMEQRLLSDLSLKEEYNGLLLTREAVRYYGLQQKVASIHRQMMQELQAPVRQIRSNKKIVRYALAIAASVVLLLGSYMAYNYFSLSPEKVFSSRYETFELVTYRSDNPADTPAEKAYREKNYSEVLRIHDAGEDHTPKGEFLCGVAALELENNKKAIKCFREVIDMNKQSTTPILNDEAEYYLSLTYVKEKEYDLSLQLLNKIKDDPAHLYHQKVSGKLIRQVKRLKD